MNRRVRYVSLILIVGLLAAGCAGWQAKTEIGKAIQYADLQKQVVVQAMVEVRVLNKKGTLSDADYAKATSVYETWGKSNDALAEGLAAWKAIGDANNAQKYNAFVDRAYDIARAFKSAIEAYGIDFTKITSKILGKKQ